MENLGKENKLMVSIILPVYNGEETLAMAADSVLNNTFQNWELIIVNDGSTDDSETIGLELAGKDKRIKYFRKENGGPGDARNFGIEKANGKYLMFIDADDKFHPEAMATMVNLAEEKDVDIVMCCIMAETPSREMQKISHSMPLNRPLTGEEAAETFLRSLLTDCSGRTPSLCNKIISSEFLRNINIKFQTWTIHGEDWIFCLELFKKAAPRMYFIDTPLYVYLHRDNSISRSHITLPEVNQFYAFDLSLALDEKYKLGEKDYIIQRFITETFDDAYSALVFEETGKAEKKISAILDTKRMKELFQRSKGLSLPLKIKLQSLIFRYCGYKTWLRILKTRASIKRKFNKN